MKDVGLACRIGIDTDFTVGRDSEYSWERYWIQLGEILNTVGRDTEYSWERY